MLSAVPDAIELSFAQGADGTAAIDYAPDKSILNGAGRRNYFRVDVRVDDLRGTGSQQCGVDQGQPLLGDRANESDIINRQKYQETAHETVQINHVHTHPGDIVSLYFDQFNRGQQTPPPQARYLVAVIDPDGYLLKEETNRADNVAAVPISPQSTGMPVSPAGAPTITVNPGRSPPIRRRRRHPETRIRRRPTRRSHRPPNRPLPLFQPQRCRQLRSRARRRPRFQPHHRRTRPRSIRSRPSRCRCRSRPLPARNPSHRLCWRPSIR